MYRISSYSCRGNYSFLELVVRQLFKGGNYSREEIIVFLLFGSGNYSREEGDSTQNYLFLLSQTSLQPENIAKLRLRMAPFGF